SSNDVVEREIEHLLQRPVGRPSRRPVVRYHEFRYQAGSWDRARRVVDGIERFVLTSWAIASGNGTGRLPRSKNGEDTNQIIVTWLPSDTFMADLAFHGESSSRRIPLSDRLHLEFSDMAFEVEAVEAIDEPRSRSQVLGYKAFPQVLVQVQIRDEMDLANIRGIYLSHKHLKDESSNSEG
ncbi:MAG: hypothetical protein HY681_07480, partial [Chloroflexi bacterium]|nr:hypothetical protein [Chloroflexota bacterium]